MNLEVELRETGMVYNCPSGQHGDLGISCAMLPGRPASALGSRPAQGGEIRSPLASAATGTGARISRAITPLRRRDRRRGARAERLKD
jgi:hypothetical protein